MFNTLSISLVPVYVIYASTFFSFSIDLFCFTKSLEYEFLNEKIAVSLVLHKLYMYIARAEAFGAKSFDSLWRVPKICLCSLS